MTDDLATLSTAALLDLSVRRYDPEDEFMWRAISELRRRGTRAELDSATAFCRRPEAAPRQVGAAVLGQHAYLD